MKRLFPIFALSLCAILVGCGASKAAKTAPDRSGVSGSGYQFETPVSGAPVAVFDTSLGEIRALLFPAEAPIAVENFITLAQSGYYDNTLFFRSVYGFAVQGGDGSANDGSGLASAWDSGRYQIEYTPDLFHYSGALCAAFLPGDAQGGTGQFYFLATLPGGVDKALQKSLGDNGYAEEAMTNYKTVGGAPYLDNTDTVFGQIISGWEVLDAIACADTDENDRPLEDITLNSVTIGEYEEQ